MLLNLLKRIVRSAASSNAASSLSKHPSPEEPLRIARDALAAGDSARAIRLLNDVLAHDPAQRDALVLLGETRQAAGDAAAAAQLFERASQVSPQDAHILMRLGVAEAMTGRYARAVERFRAALDLDPSLPDACVNLGNAYRLLGRLDEAGEAYQAVITRSPDYADAWHNYGLYLRDRNRDVDAVEAFGRALALEPGHLEARFARALALLGSGDLERGWSEYEVRLSLPRLAHGRRPQCSPRWRGEPLAGKRLLVTCEQGVGDEIVFAALLSDLEHAGGAIVLECRAKILPLLQRTFPWLAELIPHAHPPAARLATGFDYQIPIGSLASLLRTRLEDFPPNPRRLAVEPARAAHWRDWLASLGPGLKVGLCWRSNDRKEERALSCTELAEWGEVLTVPGVIFVCLQYDGCSDEVADAHRAFGVEIHEPPGLDRFDDLDGVAALMAGLDLVISAPTTVSVQAAALHVRTWQLMYGSDWHSHGTAGNPWQPSIERYARDDSYGWAPTFAAIAARLRAEVASHLGEGPSSIENAMSAYAAGALDQAETIALRILLADHAAFGDAHQLLAAIMRGRGHLVSALGHARRAVECMPDRPEQYLVQATLAQELGWQDEAAAGFEAAYRLEPTRPETALAFAQSCASRGCLGEALECVRLLAERHPDCFEARLQLGTLLFEVGVHHDAIAEYRHALSLRPQSPQAAFNLANALRVTGDFGESKALYEQALQADPDLVGAWLSLGAIAHDTCDYPRALAAYDHALAIAPDYLPARLNRAYALLASGDLALGWPAHEVRLTLPERSLEARRHAQPLWRGDSLAGRRLLVWGEQGPGDEIIFAALFEDLCRRVGSFVLECRPKLLPLFQRSFPDVMVVPRSDPPHPEAVRAHVQIPAGSLGGMLRPDLQSFPQRSTYLVADPARVEHWRERLADLDEAPKVGFCWRSGNAVGDRALSCTRIADWAPIFAVEGMHLICLQYDDCSAELREAISLGARVTRFPEVDYFDDLDEVAALMVGLDLVISAPTVVSIQSAALGVPTWQLMFGSDWQTHGTDANLWLPAIRRYPRCWDEHWKSVLAKVALDLQSFTAAKYVDRDAALHAPRS